MSAQFSREAEQRVLGAVLISGMVALEQAPLAAADFYLHEHQEIFRAMRALAAERRTIDVVLVSEWLEANATLESAGGMAYLIALAKDTLSCANVAAYAEIVTERATRRRALHLLADAHQRITGGEQMAAVVAELQGTLEGLSVTHESLDFAGVLKQAMATIEAAAERRRAGIEGLTFGVPALDNILGGLNGPKLVILAGRASLGKSALANQLALRAAAHGRPVGKLELEMGADEIGIRALAHVYRQNITQLAQAQPQAIAAVKARAIERNIRDYPIYLDESAYRLPEILSRISEWHRRYNIALALIDHLQLVATAGKNRNQELGEVTRALKRLAKRLNTPIVVLSQFNRAADKEGRKPMLADLRDTGEVEQDADIVIALAGKVDQDVHGRRAVEIGLLKNRGGRVGWLDQQDFLFDGRYQRFIELTEEDEVFGA